MKKIDQHTNFTKWFYEMEKSKMKKYKVELTIKVVRETFADNELEAEENIINDSDIVDFDNVEVERIERI